MILPSKKLVAREGITLQPWQEFRGVLEDIEKSGDLLILQFKGDKAIAVQVTLQLQDRIERELGHMISILHTDLQDRPYLVLRERELSS